MWSIAIFFPVNNNKSLNTTILLRTKSQRKTITNSQKNWVIKKSTILTKSQRICRGTIVWKQNHKKIKIKIRNSHLKETKVCVCTKSQNMPTVSLDSGQETNPPQKKTHCVCKKWPIKLSNKPSKKPRPPQQWRGRKFY